MNNRWMTFYFHTCIPHVVGVYKAIILQFTMVSETLTNQVQPCSSLPTAHSVSDDAQRALTSTNGWVGRCERRVAAKNIEAAQTPRSGNKY